MKKINDCFSSLMTAYDSKDYGEGLRISREARAECPEEGVQTLFWQACMHSQLDRDIGFTPASTRAAASRAS